MRPAEFKTAHELLGVSTKFLAGRCGVVSTRIWAYEATDRVPDVPEHASEAMRDLLNDRECAVVKLIEHLYDTEADAIPRHTDLEEFYSVVPEMRGWGALAHGLLLAEVQRRVQLPIEWAA